MKSLSFKYEMMQYIIPISMYENPPYGYTK